MRPNVRALLRPDQPPADLRDNEAEFESLLRLSKAAETQQQFDDMGRFAQQAFRKLADFRGLERYSVPFYRHALDGMASRRDLNIATLARSDPKFAAETLATYTGLYDTLLRQAQNQFVADAREQLFFQFKIDNSLHALTELYPVMPRSSAEIADTTFRLAQLRSFGRLTLATLSAELGRSGIDPQSQFDVERFFTLSTQTAVWLRKLLDGVRVSPDAAPPGGEALWKAFFTLDVFYNETTKEFERYTAFVRQKAPRVAELATPRPLPVRGIPASPAHGRGDRGHAGHAARSVHLGHHAAWRHGGAPAHRRERNSQHGAAIASRAGAGRRQRRRQASAVRCSRGLRDLSPRLRAGRAGAAGRHRCRLVRPWSARRGAARGTRDRSRRPSQSSARPPELAATRFLVDRYAFVDAGGPVAVPVAPGQAASRPARRPVPRRRSTAAHDRRACRRAALAHIRAGGRPGRQGVGATAEARGVRRRD